MTKLLSIFLFLLLAAPSLAQNYYLGPWVWNATSIDSDTGLPAPDPHWKPPNGTVSAIDLRTIPQQSLPGPVATGVGFFQTTGTLSAAYSLVGTGNISTSTITNARRNAWESKTGYRPTGSTLAAVLWEMLTAGADPTGQTRVKPLMPGVDRQLRLRFSTFQRAEPFAFGVHPHTEKVVEVEQESYREAVEDVRAGRSPPELPGMMLDYWAEKYGLDKESREWAILVPPDLRDGAVLVSHATTITESFNTANSDILGPDLAWTEVNGDIDIVSNTAEGLGDTAGTIVSARANTALSSTDTYAQANVITGATNTGRRNGPATRFAAAANTFYWAPQAGGASGNGFLSIRKVVTGTATILGTPVSQTQIALKKISANGSTIESYSGGTLVESLTDTAITAGTQSGIAFERPNALLDLDNFEAADLAAAATHTIQRRIIIQ